MATCLLADDVIVKQGFADESQDRFFVAFAPPDQKRPILSTELLDDGLGFVSIQSSVIPLTSVGFWRWTLIMF